MGVTFKDNLYSTCCKKGYALKTKGQETKCDNSKRKYVIELIFLKIRWWMDPHIILRP